MSIVRRTDRMDITVVTNGNDRYVFVQQKWQYTWLNESDTTAWTYTERSRFHNQIDRSIWEGWSSRFVLGVQGTSPFALNHKKDSFRINFDVKWVLKDGHWKVEVNKVLPGQFRTSSVNWANRIISLDTEDVNARQHLYGSETFAQYPIRHEFGHAVGNSTYAYPSGHGDEYKSISPYVGDRSSMMNIGNQLRQRHADYMIRELNQMVPNTTFYLKKLK